MLGYVELTSFVLGLTGDVPGLSVSVRVRAGRRIRVTAYGTVQIHVAGGFIEWKIHDENAAQLQAWRHTISTAGGYATALAEVTLTPSAGEHTYKVNVGRSGTTTDLMAATIFPAFVLVEDIGAA